MLENFDLVRDRLSSYACVSDRQFRIPYGLSGQEEESVDQKLRQYWADKSIPNAVKLEGFDLDLSTFDPENTSNKEMRKITTVLYSMGILDRSSSYWIDGVQAEFNSSGKEINIGKKTNLFAHFEACLEYHKSEISAGRTMTKILQTSLNTAISVVLALQERAKQPRAASLVDTKV